MPNLIPSKEMEKLKKAIQIPIDTKFYKTMYKTDKSKIFDKKIQYRIRYFFIQNILDTESDTFSIPNLF